MSNPNSLRRLVPKVEARTRSPSPADDGLSTSKRRCISSACMQCRKRKSKCDGDKPACENCSIVYKTECIYDIDTDHRRKGALKRDIRQLQEENEKRDTILDAIRNGSEADVDDIIQLVRSDEPYDSIIENIQRMSLKPMPNPEPAPTLEGELAACHGEAPRTNSGVTKHYGHTSNLVLIGSDDDQILTTIAIDQVETWTNVTNDVGLVKHLFDLYFTWSHPFYSFFSEEAFLLGFKRKQPDYCSSLLVNAVLAVACNYSDRPEARADPDDPTTVGNHFFAEARRLLAIDDRSCLTTVQALGTMSLRQVMNNHESSGWKFCSHNMTMAVELGLHLTYNSQPNATMTTSDIEVRSITFWGSFVFATVFTVCVGRISVLPTTAIQNEKLVLGKGLGKKIWKPHGDPRFPHESTGLEQPAFSYDLLVQLSYLSEIVNDKLHMFYAPRDRVTSRKLQQHHQRYQDWYAGLPTVLAIKRDGPTLPQVISLQTYGMRRAFFIIIHSSTSASIQHLVNISLQTSRAAEAAHYLTNILRMLHEMQPTYPRLTAYLKVIRGLIAKWLSVVPRNIDEALQAIKISSPLYPSSSSAISPPDPTSRDNYHANHDDFPSQILETNGRSKPASLNFTSMAPNNNNGLGVPSLASQTFLWTPFPESLDGIPFMPTERRNSNSNYNTDINRVLDSGIEGDWAQLNRDGFTMDVPWDEWGV